MIKLKDYINWRNNYITTVDDLIRSYRRGLLSDDALDNILFEIAMSSEEARFRLENEYNIWIDRGEVVYG